MVFTRKELQSAFGICPHTLRKYLRRAGVKHREYITDPDLKKLKLELGEPIREPEALRRRSE
jgi:hypothetical protein